ncbi:MAG: class I SAM-dependent methyltransferase [Polyangiaceae bacterium]
MVSDAREAYVRAARIRHPGLRFECDSAESRAAAAGAFDVVMVSAVLHHLDDGEARRLLAMAHESLRPGGRLVTLDPCRVPGQSPVARWLMDRDRGLHVRSKDGYLGIVREVFPQVVVTLRSDLLRIPYTHVILECAR